MIKVMGAYFWITEIGFVQNKGALWLLPNVNLHGCKCKFPQLKRYQFNIYTSVNCVIFEILINVTRKLSTVAKHYKRQNCDVYFMKKPTKSLVWE